MSLSNDAQMDEANYFFVWFSLKKLIFLKHQRSWKLLHAVALAMPSFYYHPQTLNW